MRQPVILLLTCSIFWVNRMEWRHICTQRIVHTHINNKDWVVCHFPKQELASNKCTQSVLCASQKPLEVYTPHRSSYLHNKNVAFTFSIVYTAFYTSVDMDASWDVRKGCKIYTIYVSVPLSLFKTTSELKMNSAHSCTHRNTDQFNASSSISIFNGQEFLELFQTKKKLKEISSVLLYQIVCHDDAK